MFGEFLFFGESNLGSQVIFHLRNIGGRSRFSTMRMVEAYLTPQITAMQSSLSSVGGDYIEVVFSINEDSMQVISEFNLSGDQFSENEIETP